MARSSAVSSSMLRSIVSAPDWQRMVAMEASRLPTARCRGVQPLNMAVSTLAPLLSSSFTDVMSRSSTAKWRAVFPLVPSCDGHRWKTMWWNSTPDEQHREKIIWDWRIAGRGGRLWTVVLVRESRRVEREVWIGLVDGMNKGIVVKVAQRRSFVIKVSWLWSFGNQGSPAGP